MSWSKVKKGRKPLKWWYYKIMCETGYHLFGPEKMYYHYLHKCVRAGFTLYGYPATIEKDTNQGIIYKTEN